MRPMRVVVADVDAENVLEVLATADQKPIEGTRGGSSRPTARRRVGPRCPGLL